MQTMLQQQLPRTKPLPDAAAFLSRPPPPQPLHGSLARAGREARIAAMRGLIGLFRAAIFFLLFAFALNNQHDATLHWFFGYQSRAPMVFIVLAAFAIGCAFGVLAMVPSWWRQRRAARKQTLPSVTPTPAPAPNSVAGDELVVLTHPPRDGL